MPESSSQSMDLEASKEQMEPAELEMKGAKPTAQEKMPESDIPKTPIKEDKAYIKATPEGVQKLFYYQPTGEQLNLQLIEGNMGEYKLHSIGGQMYYPLIVGYEEAKIMRSEGLFNNLGDPIKNFFGKNVVVVGVMQRNGGALDFAHVMPLNDGEWS